MTPLIVWEAPSYAPLAVVFVHDTFGLKPKERIIVRTKGTLRACIRLQRKAKRDGERFQYEIRRRKRLVMAPLKSLDVATDEPDIPTRLDP